MRGVLNAAQFLQGGVHDLHPKQQQWCDLTNAQKVGIIVITIVQLGLLSAAMLDLRRRAPDEINGSKRMWTAVAFINLIGPVCYFVWGRKHGFVVGAWAVA
jgi:hypothetical protein